MSKSQLSAAMNDIKGNKYTWNLYFFKISHRRKGNPYYVYKHTFKSAAYLPDYMTSLSDTVLHYQIEPLGTVQEYDGENSKTSCDKLKVDSELINEQWLYFSNSVSGAPREQVSGKYQGYILDGQPVITSDPSIILVKTGNPIISLENKNTRVFKHTANDELEYLTDELCRLYLNVDFIVIRDIMYSFNHSFEGIFNIEKTLHRLKNQAIDEIISTQAFHDSEKVQTFMNRYTSPKTFLTLKDQRMEKLNTPQGRAEISSRLKLSLSENSELIINDQEQANQLIKYLCYKIFQDKETDNLIEVNSVINDNILSS
ncbi:MAG: hypothetical protein K0S01_3257 [Herbinix sp.]|jgi:hypothetical protein|nr:hypothetical protein [Herbinix sp.]